LSETSYTFSCIVSSAQELVSLHNGLLFIVTTFKSWVQHPWTRASTYPS